jgi:hypothetical protein
VAGLYAGALADHFDRRGVQVAGKLGVFVASVALTVGAARGFPVGWFYVWAAVSSAGGTIDQSARSASVPRLVSRAKYPAAASLNQVVLLTSMIVGPALAGVAIAAAGAAPAFAVEACVTIPAGLLVLRMRAQRPEAGAGALGWRAPVEAVTFVARHRLLVGIFTADLVAMIFGLPLAVFPALALGVFHIGATGLGLLYAAPAAGALVASLTSGWVQRVERAGLVVLWAVAGWGLAIAGFGLAGAALPLGLLLLAIAGAADVFSAVFRSTILQFSIPDSVRGRMSAFNLMVVTGGPRLGDLEAGVVAYLVNPVFSVVSGGLACIVGIALIAVAIPELRAYRRAVEEPAAA